MIKFYSSSQLYVSTINFGSYLVSNSNVITNVNTLTDVDTAKSILTAAEGYELFYYKDSGSINQLGSSEKIGTGTTIKVFKGLMLINTYKIVIYGDVNCDADISISDLITIKKHLLKIQLLGGEAFQAGDIYIRRVLFQYKTY